MNIHEYQAKEILGKYGVAVPAGQVCKTPEEAKAAAEKLLGGGAGMVVVKSQIHAGGRGKGTFKSGFQGGVKLCKTRSEEAKAAGEKLLGGGAGMVVVKSQIHAGGRGKGTFKSGFQGGVKLCKT